MDKNLFLKALAEEIEKVSAEEPKPQPETQPISIDKLAEEIVEDFLYTKLAEELVDSYLDKLADEVMEAGVVGDATKAIGQFLARGAKAENLRGAGSKVKEVVGMFRQNKMSPGLREELLKRLGAAGKQGAQGLAETGAVYGVPAAGAVYGGKKAFGKKEK